MTARDILKTPTPTVMSSCSLLGRRTQMVLSCLIGVDMTSCVCSDKCFVCVKPPQSSSVLHCLSVPGQFVHIVSVKIDDVGVRYAKKLNKNMKMKTAEWNLKQIKVCRAILCKYTMRICMSILSLPWIICNIITVAVSYYPTTKINSTWLFRPNVLGSQKSSNEIIQKLNSTHVISWFTLKVY